MWLSEIRIENFRVIERVQIGLDATTVLIGENDVGKTAVLDALAAVLGPWPSGAPEFSASDVHQPAPHTGARALGIAIDLHFTEREACEWDQASFELPRAAAGWVARGRRGFTLGLRVNATNLRSRWITRTPQGAEHPAAPELIAVVRRFCPLIQARSSRMLGVGAALAVRENGASELDRLSQAVARYWESLDAGVSGSAEHDLNAGYLAARELLRRSIPGLGVEQGPSREHLAEVLGDLPATPGPSHALPLSGTASRKIAMLLIAAALVRDGSGTFAPESRPLLLIEDPEAHLHPMTLSALWSLLEPINLQKLVTTQSGDLLAAAPLAALRRLVRHGGAVGAFQVDTQKFKPEELRKFAYHLRIRNGVASFARCWLLVEGETEFWVLSELARVLGYDFAQEGVTCVEFAQCGLGPLIKMAQALKIQWHVLADGDRAGQAYAETARRHAVAEPIAERLSLLREKDIEHCFWAHGFESVYREAAGLVTSSPGTPHRVIDRAIGRRSKPGLAFSIIASVQDRGPSSIPQTLVAVIETCVRLAREAPGRALAPPQPEASARHARSPRHPHHHR
ncbi:ATP-dependent endonuclease [Niveibacterium umoris]|uniref:Putative ATP-dependent endonuclease of OLD family n=1 Tax=Niveibacterium umoris TaxID=1193620 RepID=A0A840BGN7_9RHOO|nr:DUF2813 domain-containing protein [Niveibacterium umoris]MBB4012150.1 putative ATP-dependent endonuclease of OLD family [Niveibacterium umoris]